MAALMPPSKKRENQRLAVLLREIQFSAGAHVHPNAALPELAHQCSVSTASTSNEQLHRQRLASRCQPVQVLCDDCSAKGSESRQLVFGWMELELLKSTVEILLSEHFPSGRFRRGAQEVRLLQPSLEGLLAGSSAARQCAVLVERLLPCAEVGHGQVHQGVRRTAIPTQHRVLAIGPSFRWNQRDIRDATQVQEPSPSIDTTDQRCIRHRYQRGALSSKRKISTSEVMNHRSFDQMRQERSLQHLPAGSAMNGSFHLLMYGRGWGVPDRLAMTTHQCG